MKVVYTDTEEKTVLSIVEIEMGSEYYFRVLSNCPEGYKVSDLYTGSCALTLKLGLEVAGIIKCVVKDVFMLVYVFDDKIISIEDDKREEEIEKFCPEGYKVSTWTFTDDFTECIIQLVKIP